MRKNEKAKLKIRKKYAFGRKENKEQLILPPGYQDSTSQEYQRLFTKGVIYEVILLDWIEQIDIEADGNFLK